MPRVCVSVRGLWTCIAYAHTAFPAREDCCEAWSPEKKHWCCTKQGKGCEGHHPPSVDAGYGMVWKHVQAGVFRRVALAPHRGIAACSWQVNGYWTWTAVHGHGHASMPYDCHAGMHNWRTGWSPGKKACSCSRERLRTQRLCAVQGWCCSNQHLGCEGGAAAGGGVAGAPKGNKSKVVFRSSGSASLLIERTALETESQLSIITRPAGRGIHFGIDAGPLPISGLFCDAPVELSAGLRLRRQRRRAPRRPPRRWLLQWQPHPPSDGGVRRSVWVFRACSDHAHPPSAAGQRHDVELEHRRRSNRRPAAVPASHRQAEAVTGCKSARTGTCPSTAWLLA